MKACLVLIIGVALALIGLGPDTRALELALCAAHFALLLVAALASWRLAAAFESERALLIAWRAAALWFSSWGAAQACNGWAWFRFGAGPPIPSLADLFFCAGYGAALVALSLFVYAWRSSGLILLTRAQSAIPWAAGGALAVFLAFERSFDAFYPALDVVLAVPAALLLQMTRTFRGGSLWRPWAFFLCGMLAFCVADFLCASPALSSWSLAMRTTYVLGYGSIALGAWEQWLLQKNAR